MGAAALAGSRAGRGSLSSWVLPGDIHLGWGACRDASRLEKGNMLQIAGP